MFDNEKSIEFPVKRTSEVVAALGSPRTQWAKNVCMSAFDCTI